MSRTAKGLSEQTEFFERRKLQQLKTLLSNFVVIEMTFHAKAVELLTAAYRQIEDINDKADLDVSDAALFYTSTYVYIVTIPTILIFALKSSLQTMRSGRLTCKI